MSAALRERERAGRDVVLGGLLVIAGLFILTHALWATAVSVLLLGAMALASGIVALAWALSSIGSGFWSPALTGALLTVLGLTVLRNPEASALTLTLIAAGLFLMGGVMRLVATFEHDAYRWPLLLTGIVSTGLAVVVLLDLVDATFTLLGVLLGAQALIDGLTLVLVGRTDAGLIPAGADDTESTSPR